MTMTKWFSPAVLAVVVGLAFGEDKPRQAATDDLARQLVNMVARVKNGDVVVITGEARDAELLESLSVESAKVGAHTIVTLTPSPKTFRRIMLEVPEKFDKRTSTTALKLAETATVMFTMESTDYGSTTDLPTERLEARNAAGVTVTEKYLARSVKQVFIGNSLYPTEANAKRIGLTKEELSAIFQSGMAVDYAALQKTAAAVKTRLAGKEITITSPHGTKLKVGVEPNAAFTNDGVISDDKVKAGGAAVSVYLPAGEVYTRTKPGTATGKVVVPSLAFESEPITDLTLMFEKGSLTEMTANPGKGFDRLQAQYKAAANGKEQLSSIDIGVNPAVKFPKAARDVAFPTGGVVTVGMGGDLWAGGTNKSTFGLAAGLRDATLTVDGKAVVTAGELVK